jgi:hypothetical protein
VFKTQLHFLISMLKINQEFDIYKIYPQIEFKLLTQKCMMDLVRNKLCLCFLIKKMVIQVGIPSPRCHDTQRDCKNPL